jgi:hypothetical protein
MDKTVIRVTTAQGTGTLKITSAKPPEIESDVAMRKIESNKYEIRLDIHHKEYTIRYW